jgi:hypothetical protein
MIVQGNKDLLNNELAVILNSSQSKTPCGNDPWIKKTSETIPHLVTSGYTIITSTGISTWELAIHLVNKSGGNQIIISPIYDDQDGEAVFARTIVDFHLDPQKAAMIFIKPDEEARYPKDNWLKRDRAAISLAKIMMPVSIRPGGKLQALISDDANSLKCINDFRINYEKPLVGPAHYEIGNISGFAKWNYLTHWTKTCHGPWPGENKANYYKKLLSSGNRYPHQALDTLENIITDGKIRASSNKMREGRYAIGFTEANPSQALTKLMCWRSKYVNWNFEPYGVAIDKETAKALGIRPVIYGNESDYKMLSADDKPFFQSRGRADVDWSSEREWRHIGDIDLTEIASNHLIFLAFRQREALLLRNIISGQVLSLGSSTETSR